MTTSTGVSCRSACLDWAVDAADRLGLTTSGLVVAFGSRDPQKRRAARLSWLGFGPFRNNRSLACRSSADGPSAFRTGPMCTDQSGCGHAPKYVITVFSPLAIAGNGFGVRFNLSTGQGHQPVLRTFAQPPSPPEGRLTFKSEDQQPSTTDALNILESRFLNIVTKTASQNGELDRVPAEGSPGSPPGHRS